MSFSALCIVIPAFNEARNIAATIKECQSVSEVVYVVDDGSTDETAQLAVESGASVLRLGYNRGLGFALRYGFSHALKAGFEIVATIDGDGVHSPEDLGILVGEHLRLRSDLTLGTRAGKDRMFRELPGPKAASNRLVQLSLNKIFGGSVSDWLTGMRVLSRRFLGQELETNGYSIAVELVVRGINQPWLIAEVPISVKYDAEELFATGCRELRDFLIFCDQKCRQPAFSAALQSVNRREKFRITIQGTRFICHPLIEYDSYIVQEQDQPLPIPSAEVDWLQIDQDGNTGSA